MKVMISQPMNGRCEEDIKILEEMIENANIENMDMNNCFGGEHIEAIEHILSDYKKLQEEFKQVDHECERLEEKEVRLIKENEQLKEYIAIAPNLDEMTATKYRNIQQYAYIQGRTEEQQKAEQIIYESYISKQIIKDKIKDLNRKIDESIDNSKGGLNEEFIEKSGELLAQKRILQELLGESEE